MEPARRPVCRHVDEVQPERLLVVHVKVHAALLHAELLAQPLAHAHVIRRRRHVLEQPRVPDRRVVRRVRRLRDPAPPGPARTRAPRAPRGARGTIEPEKKRKDVERWTPDVLQLFLEIRAG